MQGMYACFSRKRVYQTLGTMWKSETKGAAGGGRGVLIGKYLSCSIFDFTIIYDGSDLMRSLD